MAKIVGGTLASKRGFREDIDLVLAQVVLSCCLFSPFTIMRSRQLHHKNEIFDVNIFIEWWQFSEAASELHPLSTRIAIKISHA